MRVRNVHESGFMADGVYGSFEWSEDRRYRYESRMTWDFALSRVVTWVMINPTRVGSLKVETPSRNKMIKLSRN